MDIRLALIAAALPLAACNAGDRLSEIGQAPAFAAALAPFAPPDAFTDAQRRTPADIVAEALDRYKPVAIYAGFSGGNGSRSWTEPTPNIPSGS